MSSSWYGQGKDRVSQRHPHRDRGDGVHIAIEHLGITFATRQRATEVIALHEVSFTVERGEFIAIVGPNGCGKSTLLRAIGGLIAPSRGSIRIDGLSPDQARRARLMSFVFQDAVLLPWYTTLQNVALPLRLFGWSRAERRAAAHHALEVVGLAPFAGAYPRQLSGGMRQRAAVARAIVFEPAVLLMDEPFSALDELTREQLHGELLRIWSMSGATVLFVTHAIPEAVFLADRVLLFSAAPGRLVASSVIDLPRPRTSALLVCDAFLHAVAQVRRQFRENTP